MDPFPHAPDDSHLEMLFEDRVSGHMAYSQDEYDADDPLSDDYEPSAYESEPDV